MKIIRQIIREIEKYQKIIILRHILPDGDAYGSQLGLKALIETNYPDKQVFAFGEEATYLTFIGDFDEMVDPNIFEQALVIVTDCGNLERIDNQHFTRAAKLIKIDHHPDATPYGDISWVDTGFTSASEMVGLLAISAGWKITPAAAKIIYHGICTDSGRFMFGAISQRTFEVAAKLVATGFDLSGLYQTMYKRSFASLVVQSELIASAKITAYGVGYIILTDELVKKHNLDYGDNGKFSNLLKDIEEIDIWITFSIREDQQWRIEFRSKTIPINQLAIDYGGGGHKLASGAIIKDLSEVPAIIEQANQLVINSK